VHGLDFGFFGPGHQLHPAGSRFRFSQQEPDPDWIWIFQFADEEWFVRLSRACNCQQLAIVAIVLQVLQSVPHNDRKVHYADAMHE